MEWNSDNALRWSASVAFYSLLSLTPLLVLIVAIGGLFYGKETAQAQLALVLHRLAGFDVSPAIRILLNDPQKPMTGLIAAVSGTVILFFGGSSVLLELRDALNAIWHAPVHPSATEFADLFRLATERIYSFLVILGLGTVLLASLALNTCLAAIGTFYEWPSFSSGFAFRLMLFLISFLAMTFVFAAIYKFIPDVPLSWSEVAVGGVVTSLLFSIGKQLIMLYVAWTDLGSAYGAAGSIIVLLVWVYYSAQVFFLGAEFTKVYAEAFGPRKLPPGLLEDRVARGISITCGLHHRRRRETRRLPRHGILRRQMTVAATSAVSAGYVFVVVAVSVVDGAAPLVVFSLQRLNAVPVADVPYPAFAEVSAAPESAFRLACPVASDISGQDSNFQCWASRGVQWPATP